MPYINEADRQDVARYGPMSAGQLNYAITLLIKDYITENQLSYATLNDIVGALECAKLEMYRRIAVPYENSKLAMNGDVY